MKKDETNELLRLGGALQRGYGSIVSNAGRIIAAITLGIAILVTFTDVAFSRMDSAEFTTALFVMLLSSYLMYFSLEDTGEKEGEGCEQFISAKERYLSVRGKITPEHIDALRKFCLDYSRRELEYRRLSYLAEMGYSAGDAEEFYKGKRCDFRAKRAFRRAKRMRAVKLSPSMLLSHTHLSAKSELSNPKYKKLFSSLLSLIPSTVCMVFTVSIILTAKDGLSPSSVLEGVIKLSALPIIGLKGTLDGFRFTKDEKSAWLETKARLLESFIGEEAKCDY